MKTIVSSTIIILIAITCSFNSAASTVVPDSTLHYDNPGTITIIENGDGVKVVNENGETLFHESYENAKVVKTKKSFSGNRVSLDDGGLTVVLPHPEKKWALTVEGLGFGLNGALNQPSGTGLEWGKSFDITWLYALGIEYRHGLSKFSFGIGFDWKNFKMTNENYRMLKNPGGGITVGPYPEGSEPKNSTLKIFSIGFPLLYHVKIPYLNSLLSVGPILNVSTHASLKTKFINTNGNETQEYVSGLGQKTVTVDLFGAFTYNGVGIYLRYSPVKSMKNVSPVNFNPMTVGLMFCL